MKVVAAIPYVNRPDLLDRAIASLLPFVGSGIDSLYVINNSGFVLDRMFDGVGVLTPTLPLSFAQTQNVMQGFPCDVLIFAHADMEASPEAVARVLAAATHDTIVFSHYDILAAFGRAVMDRVGPWDTQIPWYYSDNDWYRRARLLGIPIVEVGGDGITHHASSTMLSDWRLALATNDETRRSKQVYAEKWGGLPDQERFTVPYDGARLLPPVATLQRQPRYHALINAYAMVEGTLFEHHSQESIWAQLRAIAWAFDLAGRPTQVLETGTAKGLFAYLLSWLCRPGTQLLTCDSDPRCADVVQGSTRDLAITFLPGDTTQTLLTVDLAGIGFAWIDGGHDQHTTLSNLRCAMDAQIGVIAVDDTVMDSVNGAVRQALITHPAYVAIDHPWFSQDSRKIAVLVCRD